MGITTSDQIGKQGLTTEGPTLLLLRHGQIKANRVGRWHGSTDSALTFRGRRQARRTSRLLRTSQQRIDRVIASPLTRCQHTAELAVAHLNLPIETHPGLAEMDIGAWEDMPFERLQAEHNLFGEITNNAEFTPPDGESIMTVCDRTVTALKEVAAAGLPDQVILVVSHGVAMGIALAALLEGKPTQWRDYQMANCALSELRLKPEPTLFGFNQNSHI